MKKTKLISSIIVSIGILSLSTLAFAQQQNKVCMINKSHCHQLRICDPYSSQDCTTSNRDPVSVPAGQTATLWKPNGNNDYEQVVPVPPSDPLSSGVYVITSTGKACIGPFVATADTEKHCK